MENAELTPVRVTFSAAVGDLVEALRRVADAWRRMAAALAEALKPAIRWAARLIGGWADAQLRAVATGKEWHLLQHARKARTRKKYRNRLIRRWLALLDEHGEEAEDENA